MATFKPTPADHVKKNIAGKDRLLLKKDSFSSFNTSLLGLGDLAKEAVATDAMAAIFDLQGFTRFCGLIEPHLSVPLFLSEFLAWLMDELRNEMKQQEFPEGIKLWSPLPFLTKFMGDGLLVLWDSSKMGEVGRRNAIISARHICDHYRDNFFPKIRRRVVEPPAILRCGLARGTVYSVGNGNDYVGTCINIAARIQKLPGTTFAFNQRGFTLDTPDVADFFTKSIVVRQVAIRGIGDNEQIAILRTEFEAMTPEDKKLFRSL